MASWSQTFSVNNKYSLTLTCTEQSYSVANNTSVVAYSLVMATAANSFTGYSDYKTTISCSINGTTVYSYSAARDFNASAKSSYSETLCSGTATVAHNADGSKSCACAASVTVASGAYSPGSASISQSLTLTTIPRASTASWSGNFVIGSSKVITITRASSSFTHKLTFSLGSQSQTAPSGSYAATSYTWTPAAATWASQLPTQTSRTGTLTLTTYNGSTVIGSNTYTFTLEIPSSWAPTVAVTLSPVSSNAFVSGTGEYVQSYSSIRAAITGTATTGATISSYTISGAFSKTVNTSASSTTQTSGVIATSGNKTVTVKITDSRGKTATVSASCTYRAYTYPAITAASYARGTYSGGAWTPSDSGEDLRITFTGSCSLSSYGNEMSWSIGTPVSSSGSSLASGSSITQYATGIGTVTAYNVVITVTDSVGNRSTRSVYVPTLEIPFVIDPGMPAIGVGAVPQTARTLEVAKSWYTRLAAGFTGLAGAKSRDPSEVRDLIIPHERMTYTTLGVSSGVNNVLPAYVKAICENYPGRDQCLFFGGLTPGNAGFVMFMVYDTSNLSGDYPQYSSGIYIDAASGATFAFGTTNYVYRQFSIPARSVTKTATISFSAGTIGTRGYQTSWSSSAIGGTPLFVQITHIANSAGYHAQAFIENGTVYLNAYRATSSAVSNSTVDVTIWY